jgi:hypothetical protein
MGHVLFQGAEEVFAHGEALLEGLTDTDFSRRIEGDFAASIGAHDRRCLEHFGSLFAGIAGADVDYDARSRCPQLENIREVALARTRELHAVLRSLLPGKLDQLILFHSQGHRGLRFERKAAITLANARLLNPHHPTPTTDSWAGLLEKGLPGLLPVF